MHLRLIPFFFLLLFLSSCCKSEKSILSLTKPDTPEWQNEGFENCDSKSNGEVFLLKAYLRPHQIVYDVGANVGKWSQEALNIEPKIHIAAFEPVPIIFERLNTNKILKKKSVTFFNLALSNECGNATFYYFDKNWDTSQLSGFYNRKKVRTLIDAEPQEIQVELETLDHFCTQLQTNEIDFLKIDTEGAEYKVLLGAKKMLKEGRIKAIQFEYGGTYIDAGITLKEVITLLTQNNYVIFRIIPNGLVHISKWRDELENMRYSNYFAILAPEVPDYPKIGNLEDLY